MLIECSKRVAASAHTVFACVDEPAHIVAWVGGAVEHAYLTDRSPAGAIGQRFRQRLRQGDKVRVFEGEIVAWAPAAHFALRIPTAAYTSEAHFRIAADGPGRSTVAYSIDVALHSWRARALAWLLRIPLGLFVRGQVGRLQSYAETVECGARR